MKSHRIVVLLAAAMLLPLLAMAGDTKAPAAKAPRMDAQTRMNLIRGLNAELVYIRRVFPMGEKGLTIKNGIVSPNDNEVKALTAAYGPSVKPGDRARISNVYFKGDKIVFEINDGPKKKTKWYQHIQLDMGGGAVQAPSDPRMNPRGSYVALAFDGYVPQLSVEQVKQMLSPVFDFNALSAAEAYLSTVPPKVKEAIKNHQVLVGMNREMVLYSKGRPPKKDRETADGKDYEEWIYGQPPQDVCFVRFIGDEVVRVETMKVSGEKVVATTKEVDIKKPTPAVADAAQPGSGPAELGPDGQPKQKPGAPSLRRPGEEIGQQDAGAPVPQSQIPMQIPGAPRPQDNPGGPPLGGPGGPPMPGGGPGTPGQSSPLPGGAPGQPPCCRW
ncbi:MAG TPA: hypothetical protein VFU76_16990 [Terriglobales bacterium]|nr:hypothetical protein [Terriglobales bacterium]